MPVAEDLLGVRFDIQMLAKLALSVAGVLLVSWAYRFYNSRRWHTRWDRPAALQPHRTAGRWEPDMDMSPEGSADSREEELHRPDELCPREALSAQSKHLLREPLSMLSPGDIPLVQQNIPSPGDITSVQQNIPSPGEIPVGQQMRSPGEPQNIPSVGDAFSNHHEDSPEEPHNTPLRGETFSDKYKDSSAEAQRAHLNHVEPDVTIVRGDENLNHAPNLPMEKSMVQHDPSGIKRTPVAHDLSTQRALHTSGDEAEGRLDASLVPGFSPSPTPVKDLDQFGVSPTGRRSPCKLGREEPNTSMGQELRQDRGHLSKKEVRINGRDVLLNRDGDTPHEVHRRIHGYHMESSLRMVSDKDLLASHSTPKHTGELCEAAMLNDPQELNKPKASSTEAIHPERQGLARKDSYKHIVENADLQIPILSTGASTPLSTLSSPSSEDLHSKPLCPVKDPIILSKETSRGAGLEGVGRLSISQIPTEGSSPELERLLGSLDLGNCLHALSLARKEGHTGLQNAALKVMSDNYLQVLQDPGLYGSLRGGDRDLIRNLRTRGKRCLVVADLDLQDSAGSESSVAKTSGSLYYYDDHNDSWKFLCPLPKEVVSRGSAMCVMDNYLFVTLGCLGSGRDVQPSKRAFCYNPATSIWKEISPMNEARPQCKLVALGGCIYAIGGECLSSVERYDPRTGCWAFVAPMPNDTFAVAHRATACNGELFVSGGTLRYTLLRYNPDTNSWRRSLIMGSKERTVEMVAVRSFLYRFDVGSTSGLSVYRYHTAARLWYECGSRGLPPCPAFQSAAMDDIIYCVSRRATMKFLADEVSPTFIAKDLSTLSAAKGTLLPFIFVLPETEALQTSV